MASFGRSFLFLRMVFLFADAGAPAQFITLGIAILGVAGLIFTALKFNRDDSTSIVNQQTAILNNMATLNSELRSSDERLRAERDELMLQTEKLNGQVEELRRELQMAHAQLSGQVTRIEKRLEEDG